MLEGKKILVAGATGHIGEQVARFLVQSGAAVILVGRNADKLKKNRGFASMSHVTHCGGYDQIR